MPGSHHIHVLRIEAVVRLTGSLVSVTFVLIHKLCEGSYGAVPEEQHDQHWHHDPHLELPVDLSPGPPHHDQGQHAQSIEEGGGHHVHVEQLVDVLQQSEEDPESSCEEETRERGESVLVNIRDDSRQMSLSASRVNLTPRGKYRGVEGSKC